MNQRSAASKDEFTVKELVLNAQSLILETLANWKILFLFVIPPVALMLYNAYTEPVTYTAPLTFTVNESGKPGLGGVGSLLNEFGFGGGGGIGKFNRDRIVEIALSLRIAKGALFEKCKINGQEDYFANHIIRTEQLHEKWLEDTTGLKDFLFTHGRDSIFNKLENKALKQVYSKVKGNAQKNIEGLIKVSYNEDSNIFAVICKGQNQELSAYFVQAIYDKLSRYYIESSTRQPKVTYLNLRSKSDSLAGELKAADYALANFEDTNRYLRDKRAKLQKYQLERKVKLLTLAYGKIVENLEIADFTLKNATPVFQVLDLPLMPLKANVKSKIMAIFIGGFIGGILGVGFILGRKVIREVLSDNPTSY